VFNSFVAYDLEGLGAGSLMRDVNLHDCTCTSSASELDAVRLSTVQQILEFFQNAKKGLTQNERESLLS
ncbi:MAG TPA: hypothetical protein VEY70_22965, partial [Metabacillus sp.]|nr:hypothetical protein [Metabacillus sp.]